MLWRRWSTKSGDQSKIASGGSVSIRCSLFLDRNSVNLESRAQSRKEKPPTWESDFTESEREMQVFPQTWGKCVDKTSKAGIWWWGIGKWLQTWPLVSNRSKFKFCFCHLLARCSSYILLCNKPPQCLVAWINNHVFVQKFCSLDGTQLEASSASLCRGYLCGCNEGWWVPAGMSRMIGTGGPLSPCGLFSSWSLTWETCEDKVSSHSGGRDRPKKGSPFISAHAFIKPLFALYLLMSFWPKQVTSSSSELIWEGG